MKLKLQLILAVAALAINASATVAIKQQEQSLKITHQVAPLYPEEAKRAKVEGKVVLDVTVEENGEVSMAKVVNGPTLLQQAAVDAAKQWRFSNPLNAPVTVQLTLAFTLKADSETENQRKARGSLKNTHKVDAVYPEEAKRRGIQGEVAVEIKVNTDGEVTDARAVSGNEALRQAAVDAAKQFRFSNDFNAAVTATLTFNFVLGK
jgi:bla regulator protein blaR1